MLNKILFLFVLLFGFVFADQAMDVQPNGLYVAYETTVNVTAGTPVLVTPAIVAMTTPSGNKVYAQFLADGIIIVPQASQTYTDVWYDTNVAQSGITTNIVISKNVIVWRPVGSMVWETNYRQNILYPSGSTYGINGVQLKKDSGSAVIGVQFLSKPKT